MRLSFQKYISQVENAIIRTAMSFISNRILVVLYYYLKIIKWGQLKLRRRYAFLRLH